MIVMRDDSKEISRMKKMLTIKFELKDLEKLRYFFGIELTRSKIGLILNQIKYTLDLLKDIEKLDCHPISTSIEANYKINIKYGDKLTKKEKDMYQWLEFKLIYLTLTRSDITYIVNMVSQLMHVPINIHLQRFDSMLLKEEPQKKPSLYKGGYSFCKILH